MLAGLLLSSKQVVALYPAQRCLIISMDTVLLSRMLLIVSRRTSVGLSLDCVSGMEATNPEEDELSYGEFIPPLLCSSLSSVTGC